MDIYLNIQLIEREFKYAIDNFINYHKMDHSNEPTIDGLPYKPILYHKYKKRDCDELELTSFTIYGYSISEYQEIIKILKKLFTIRPVWTKDDLWKAVKNPVMEIKTAYDHSTFCERNFLIALDFLVNNTNIENLNYTNINNNVDSCYINLSNELRRGYFKIHFLYYVLRMN